MRMIYFLFIFTLPFIIYIFQTEQWRRVWNNTSDFVAEESDLFLSLIIPYRNEANNLPFLLKSLLNQNYHSWELILVDDHSEDEGLSGLRSILNQFEIELKCIPSDGKGKKAALKSGAKLAKGRYVVSTDADCTFHPSWLKTIASFCSYYDSDLVIAPVLQLSDGSLLSNFQISEFVGLQISGAASALNGNAIMLNGANLVCKTPLYLQADLKANKASGDDMFLLEWVKEQGGRVDYLKSSEAMVYTQTEKNVSAVLAQKARWAAKARYYSDRSILKSGLLVALINVILLILLVWSIIDPVVSLYFLIVFVLRLLADYRLLESGSQFFVFAPCIRELVLWQFLYPFYVGIVMLYSVFMPLEWKGRKI